MWCNKCYTAGNRRKLTIMEIHINSKNVVPGIPEEERAEFLADIYSEKNPLGTLHRLYEMLKDDSFEQRGTYPYDITAAVVLWKEVQSSRTEDINEAGSILESIKDLYSADKLLMQRLLSHLKSSSVTDGF